MQQSSKDKTVIQVSISWNSVGGAGIYILHAYLYPYRMIHRRNSIIRYDSFRAMSREEYIIFPYFREYYESSLTLPNDIRQYIESFASYA